MFTAKQCMARSGQILHVDVYNACHTTCAINHPPVNKNFKKKKNFFVDSTSGNLGVFLISTIARVLFLSQPLSWSGRRDSNSRPTVPKTVALPGCATPRESSAIMLHHCSFEPKIPIFQGILSQECTAPAIFPLGPSTT